MYSVVIRWKGKNPFNGTIDAVCNLSKLDANMIADVYARKKQAHKVSIVKYLDDDMESRVIKAGGRLV